MIPSFGFPSSMTNLEFGHFAPDSRHPELFVKIPSTNTLKKELRYATQYLTAHKLYHSAKWYFFFFIFQSNCYLGQVNCY